MLKQVGILYRHNIYIVLFLSGQTKMNTDPFLTVIPAVFLFAVATCFSPGPNNLMLTASGARFGYRKTLPAFLGIFAGWGGLMVLAALGLGALFDLYPPLQWALKLAGAVYLIWLAWKLSFSGSLSEGSGDARPVTFWQAVLLQFVNPKGMTMAIGSVSAFTLPGDAYAPSALIVLSVMLGTYVFAGHAWLFFGQLLTRLCRTPRQVRVTNGTLGALTLASVVFIFWSP
ncbi:MAG: LysE family translocator [Gammaproteobacteria bacterium]|nr:MAG: LysE family translocator [Gammaproteobacteria bacterium]